MMTKLIDITGKKFGRLTAVKERHLAEIRCQKNAI